MSRKRAAFATLGLAAVAAAFLAGCSQSVKGPAPVSNANSTQEAKVTEKKIDTDHAHKPGSHNGNIVEIGRDNYHAEVVFDKAGTLRLYVLGKDEAKIEEVDSQVLTAYAKSEGGEDPVSFTLRPVPQPGDAAGKTSQFVGKLPPDLVGKSLAVTIQSLAIGGERFRFSFASSSHAEDGPAAKADAEERTLYLTPGGKYTEADIQANGNQTAAQKFQGLMASHDLKPKPGDKVCPITLTKANPKFTWIVGGKEYEFCCPPCVDEFLQNAKDHPEAIKEPQDYVKK